MLVKRQQVLDARVLRASLSVPIQEQYETDALKEAAGLGFRSGMDAHLRIQEHMRHMLLKRQ
jgi:hypothetical protein